MTKIKLCGNRTPEDLAVTHMGDAQGFLVGAPESPRNLAPDDARALMDCVSPFTTSVLVTQAEHPDDIAELADRTDPDAVQAHAELEPEMLGCIRAALPENVGLIGVMTLDPTTNERPLRRARDLAESPIDALLVDTRVAGQNGGTGVPHDWTLTRRIRDAILPCPLILAGGLSPSNVGPAIATVRPYAVDVSSGIELEGAKSADLARALVEEVRHGDRPALARD